MIIPSFSYVLLVRKIPQYKRPRDNSASESQRLAGTTSPHGSRTGESFFFFFLVVYFRKNFHE